MNQEKCKNGECNMLDGHNHISCISCHTSPKEEISKCCGDIALKQVGGLYGCRKCESYCEIVNDWESEFDGRFGGEGTIAKTDENCILIGFTKKEVKQFIRSLLSSTEKRVAETIKEWVINDDEVYINEDIRKARNRMKESIITKIKSKYE